MNKPLDWVDSDGDGCSVYSAQDYCTPTGGVGPGWSIDWGAFADYATDGKDASEACCACGGGGELSGVPSTCSPVPIRAPDPLPQSFVGSSQNWTAPNLDAERLSRVPHGEQGTPAHLGLDPGRGDSAGPRTPTTPPPSSDPPPPPLLIHPWPPPPPPPPANSQLSKVPASGVDGHHGCQRRQDTSMPSAACTLSGGRQVARLWGLPVEAADVGEVPNGPQWQQSQRHGTWTPSGAEPPPPQGASGQQSVVKDAGLRRPIAPKAPDAPRAPKAPKGNFRPLCTPTLSLNPTLTLTPTPNPTPSPVWTNKKKTNCAPGVVHVVAYYPPPRACPSNADDTGRWFRQF